MYDLVNSVRRAAATALPVAAASAAVWLGVQAPRAAESADLLPEAPAKAVILRACANCHQPAEIVAKRRTAEDWDAVIAKMLGLGAQLSEAEEEQVYTYLAANFGPEKPAGN
jgi:mono/diheme cytochrome c family protein